MAENYRGSLRRFIKGRGISPRAAGSRQSGFDVADVLDSLQRFNYLSRNFPMNNVNRDGVTAFSNLPRIIRPDVNIVLSQNLVNVRKYARNIPVMNEQRIHRTLLQLDAIASIHRIRKIPTPQITRNHTSNLNGGFPLGFRGGCA